MDNGVYTRKTIKKLTMRKFLCATHAEGGRPFSFPVYPPGYVPYARRSLVAIAHDGRPLDTEPEGHDPPVFTGTVFDAALDAARGTAWDRTTPEAGHSDDWWPTQGRDIEDALQLFGLNGDVTPAERDEICEILSIDRVIHGEARKLCAVAPGYRNRGAAVARILSAIAGNREIAGAILRRLLLLGHRRGRWGAPTLWDETAKRFARLSFLRSGTDPPRGRTRSGAVHE